MIINNKYLNSKPVYDIPEDVQVGIYRRGGSKVIELTPGFEPNICINAWGTIRVKEYKETAFQICVKTPDDGLLNYLKEYDWWLLNSSTFGNLHKISGCAKWQIEKIISEYYANIK